MGNGLRKMAGLAAAGIVLAAPIRAQQAQDATIARLIELNGNVLVSRDAGLTSANEGLRLALHTRVLTTANSQVVVEYDDGCRVKLEENQRFEVERGKPCALLVAVDLLPVAAAAAPLASIVVPALIGGGGLAMLIDARKQPSVSPN